MLPNFNNNGPCYEIFNSTTDIIKYWKQKGKITKEFESHTKTYIYSLPFGGVSGFSIPINEKHSLLINNSCLLFQFILFNNKSFSIEIGIKDKSDTKRRFNLTSSIKEIESKSLYIKIPLNDYPLNIWTNLLIDIEALTQQYFKTQIFKVIDNIHFSGCLKIRKIFSLRSRDEPLLKSIDMGKSIPVANLFFMDNTLIKTDIKIIGINNFTVNNVNIDSNNIRNVLNSPHGNNRNNNSPLSNNNNNGSKYSTTSDINLNKYRKYYKKNNENNNSNNLSGGTGVNITPINNNRVQMENASKKTRDAKKFVKGLPNLSNVTNDIKYAVIKNMKNSNIEKILGNSAFEENEIANSNKGINLNNKEKGKSLGKYVKKQQQNKKRNKSNNPFRTTKLNKKVNENSDNSGNNDNKNLSNKNIIKEEINNTNNIKNININNNNANKTIIKDKKNNINNTTTPIKKKEKENKERSNDHVYYNQKEQEISMEEYNNYKKNNNNAENINIPSMEDKFKFNNIGVGLSSNLTNKNSFKDTNKHENDIRTNKYSNCGGLLDSKFDINNIPVYDSIEEVAEWPADLNANQNNPMIEDAMKMGDRLIQLESNKNNNINNDNNDNDNMEGDDFVELSSVLNKKDTLRPYTPPIEELVQVNPNKMKGDSNMKCSMDRKNGLMNTNRILRNYENLIYNQDKGLFFDPKTNIYYDIKAK
jgi:hypothetical protein